MKGMYIGKYALFREEGGGVAKAVTVGQNDKR